MVEKLSKKIENFPGEASRVCCFAHVLQLVAKNIIQQFDVPKENKGGHLDVALLVVFVVHGNIILIEGLAHH